MPLKQLTITPVSFPTTTQPTIPPTSNPPSHPHRIPSAAFHPTHTHTTPQSSLPFRSFDISSATSSFPSPGLGLGPFPSSSSSSSLFLDEPPLLEELEINPALILQKTRSLLNPFNPNPSLHASEPDLSGPFLYYPAFSLFQLLAGKLQFGLMPGQSPGLQVNRGISHFLKFSNISNSKKLITSKNPTIYVFTIKGGKCDSRGSNRRSETITSPLIQAKSQGRQLIC